MRTGSTTSNFPTFLVVLALASIALIIGHWQGREAERRHATNMIEECLSEEPTNSMANCEDANFMARQTSTGNTIVHYIGGSSAHLRKLSNDELMGSTGHRLPGVMWRSSNSLDLSTLSVGDYEFLTDMDKVSIYGVGADTYPIQVVRDIDIELVEAIGVKDPNGAEMIQVRVIGSDEIFEIREDSILLQDMNFAGGGLR